MEDTILLGHFFGHIVEALIVNEYAKKLHFPFPLSTFSAFDQANEAKKGLGFCSVQYPGCWLREANFISGKCKWERCSSSGFNGNMIELWDVQCVKVALVKKLYVRKWKS